MRIRIFALLSLAFLLTQANAFTRVPMSIANNEYCSYFYGDYEKLKGFDSKAWNDAEDGVVAVSLDDRENHSWTYYSDENSPMHSLNPKDVVIKYYANGWNLADNVTVTGVALGIDDQQTNAFFYYKTLEQVNGEYIYTTIPNPFSKRPVRAGKNADYGDNTKWLGFAGWRVKSISGGSITGVSVGDVISAETDFSFVPTADDGMVVDLEAAWDKANVYYVTTTQAIDASGTIQSTLHNITEYGYERNFIVIKEGKYISSLTVANCSFTVMSVEPDASHDYRNSGGISATSITAKQNSSTTRKFEYVNFSASSSVNMFLIYTYGSTSNNNSAFKPEIVMGRGVVSQNPINLTGVQVAYTSDPIATYLMKGVKLRIESGNYNKVVMINRNNAGSYYGAASQTMLSVHNSQTEGASLDVVFGSDYDRGIGINTNLTVAGYQFAEGVKMDEATPLSSNVCVKSGVIAGRMNFGLQFLNYQPAYNNNNTHRAGRYLFANRNLLIEGGLIQGSIFGGPDSRTYFTSSQTYSAAYSSSNSAQVKDSLNSFSMRMKGGTVNGNIFGGDSIYDAGGTYRQIIADGERDIIITKGTIGGNVYGGSFIHSSLPSDLSDKLKYPAFYKVNMYVGGDATVSGGNVYGGDCSQNTIKVIRSVGSVNLSVCDEVSLNNAYGAGYASGVGRNDTLSNINIYSTNNSNIYGGSYNADTVWGNVVVNIAGGTHPSVFGGGNGTSTHVSGNVNINMNSGTISSLYGGAYLGSCGTFASDETRVTINGGGVVNVYGGGYTGITNSSNIVTITGGTVSGDVFAGAYGGASSTETVYAKGLHTVNITDNANVSGNVYGGSYNSADMVSAVSKPADIPVGSEQTRNFAMYQRTVYGYNAALIHSDVVGGPKLIQSLHFPYVMSQWGSVTASDYPVTRNVKIYLYSINGDNISDFVGTQIKIEADGRAHIDFSKGQQPDGYKNLNWKVDAAHKVFDGTVTTNYGDETLVYDLDTPFEYDGESHLLICVYTNGGSGTPQSGQTPLPALYASVLDGTYPYGSMVIGGGSSNAGSWETNKPSDVASGFYYPVNQVPIVYFGASALPSQAAKQPLAYVNVTKGTINGSVYGGGYNNKMIGGCYVNIGKDAVEKSSQFNVNALENPATGAITIGGSVYAGSNSTGAWSYANADRSVNGVSEVYLDGNGYDGAITIGSSKAAAAGNIYGCSTNGEGGKLGSSVYISNIGSRDKEGKYLSATTWGLGSVQHTDTLVLNNAHVTFNGAQQLEGSTNNSVYGVHKVMRVVNNSTALLKADADSIAKVGSYECTDVYTDSPVYTEVTAVSGATGKTQLADCKNTIVFDGGELYIRNMVSGTETYGELNGYLYAVNTDSEHTANARARQKETNNSHITNGTNNASDGGFVSYDATFNTYANPTADGYDGTGGKQEIAFTNVDSETYRIWDIQASTLPNLWTEYVTSRPPTFPDDVTITTGGADYLIALTCEDDLAWFISYVNGFNGSSVHPSAKAKLTADVDMSSLVWVPIGINSSKPFSGVFDGNYHTIDGIHIADATEVGYVEGSAVGTNGDMTHTGMFGYAYGATIRNTFVMSGRLANTQNEGYIGGLVAYATSTNIEMCETADTLTASSKFVGGIVGYMDTYNNVNSSIVASMSTANITDNYSGGYGGSLGGIAARATFSDYLTISDCFSNVTFSGNSIYYQGIICGWAIPKNSYMHKNASAGTITKLVHSSVPTDIVGYNLYAPNSFTGTATGKFTDAAAYQYGDYTTNNAVTVGEETKPLVDKLNDNANANYQWIRPKGSMVINGGYPFVARKTNDTIMAVVGISNDKRLYYGEANEMITKYGSNPNADIYVYSNGTLTTSPTAARLFIDENVAIMQDISSKAADDIVAYVGITFDNSKGTAEMHRDWHMFSSAIEKGKTGVVYGDQSMFDEFTESDMTFGTHYSLEQGNDSVYFPDGITTAISNPGKQFDLYSFYEPEYHWINLKRASGNHWHEDEPHNNIVYNNEETYTPGKGYMIALGDNATKNNNLMQAKGTLNKGHITVPVTATGEHLTGYNLIGNPYQSYLDFNKFANANEDIWTEGETGYKAYLIYNADKDGFVEYLVDNAGVTFSHGAAQEGDRYINMHQGFFVVKNGTATEAVFEDTMRVTNQTPHFRDELPAYPLVNLFCTDSDGKQEINVMEFERPLKAGSLKMKGMLNGKCNMYIHWSGDDLGAVFIDYMPDYVPVWFEAAEDGVFTITWSTANANFGYMHLIDNITGTDYDCLAPGHDHYTFSASTTDMRARFRVVFKPLGIEEEMSEQGEDFAFISGEELVVNGIGELSFIDLNGRVLATEFVSGQQCHIALPNVAEGMYLLRLAGTNGVKVQKIVIRK